MVLRELRLRYRSTLLGFFWSLAKPGCQILLFYVIFQLVLKVGGVLDDFIPGANYGVYVAIGIITWTFLGGAILQGLAAYVDHQHLISKASFWRPVLPLACVLSHWVHYLFAQAVLVVFLGFMGSLEWGFEILYLIPLSLVELALVASVVWLLAWFQVLARDTLQFADLGLMIWFYGSPIIYPASTVLKSNALSEYLSQAHVALLYLANPMAPILVLRQRVLMSNLLVEASALRPTPDQLRDTFMLSLFTISMLFLLAMKLNRRADKHIADRL
jgi:ABC-2 type transport system permease protein